MIPPRPLRPLILSLSGPTLTAAEAALYASAAPAGVILFRRNLVDPDQARALVTALREAAADPALPVLIDQEGGRVQRLGPPHWPRRPPPAALAAAADPVAACRQGGLDLAADVLSIGATINCMPLADVPAADADPIIGDRALGHDPATVARNAQALAEGLWAGGVVPVVKHLPGHGRATADSHKALPVVDAPLAELRAVDLAAFRPLAHWPLAMTAHVVYSAIDPDQAATLSPAVVGELIRGEIGFAGVLMGDDIGMGALYPGAAADGPRPPDQVVALAGRSLEAGCDLVLHCNGEHAEMVALANAFAPLDAAGSARLRQAMSHHPLP